MLPGDQAIDRKTMRKSSDSYLVWTDMYLLLSDDLILINHSHDINVLLVGNKYTWDVDEKGFGEISSMVLNKPPPVANYVVQFYSTSGGYAPMCWLKNTDVSLVTILRFTPALVALQMRLRRRRLEPETWISFFMYAPSQWEATLQCNVASHWLRACSEWSLNLHAKINQQEFPHLAPNWLAAHLLVNLMSC